MYGSLIRANAPTEEEYIGDGFYKHPAYVALATANQKLDLIRMLLDEVLNVIPPTEAKNAALLQLHTTSMWMDRAMQEGHRALRAAYIRVEEQRKEEAYAQASACSSAQASAYSSAQASAYSSEEAAGMPDPKPGNVKSRRA